MFLLFDVVIPSPVPSPPPSAEFLWLFLPVGYILTVAIETPFLLLLFPSKVTIRERFFCGAWLTGCTYPVVILVLAPLMIGFGRIPYLLVAETFAPLAECLLFWAVFRGREGLGRKDWVVASTAIVLANLASFGIGEVLNSVGWFGLFQ